MLTARAFAKLGSLIRVFFADFIATKLLRWHIYLLGKQSG